MQHGHWTTTLCVLLASTVLGQTGPVVTIPFDQDFNGMSAKGPVVGAPQGKPELVAGKVGQALKSGPTLGYVDYPTDLLSNLAGTVEMWVCPLDWLPDDGKFHVFFETRGEGALYLYKYWVGTNLLMLTCDNVQGPYASSQHPVGNWKPGEWHHIAGTWSPKGVMAYVDGKPAGKLPMQGALPKSPGKTFHIGDRPWQFERTTASLVDEVRIYDRALSPAHIAAHCAGNYAYTAPLAKDSTALDYSIDAAAGTVQVDVDTCGADVTDAQLGVRLAIVPHGETFRERAASAKFMAGRATAALPLPSQTPGRNQVLARLMLDGKPCFDLARELTTPTTEWLESQVGLEFKVLPPWTAMRARSAE